MEKLEAMKCKSFGLLLPLRNLPPPPLGGRKGVLLRKEEQGRGGCVIGEMWRGVGGRG